MKHNGRTGKDSKRHQNVPENTGNCSAVYHLYVPVLDGAGKLRTFFQIVFPLLKPTTATLVILYALSLWNDYLLPSLILTDKSLYTIPIATKLFQGTYSNDMDLLMAALVMAIIPVIILYIALQKYIIAGVVAGAVKS